MSIKERERRKKLFGSHTGLKFAFICLQPICVLCLAATAGRRVGLAVVQWGQIRWGLMSLLQEKRQREMKKKKTRFGIFCTLQNALERPEPLHFLKHSKPQFILIFLSNFVFPLHSLEK